MSQADVERLRTVAADIGGPHTYAIQDGLARSIWEDKYARRIGEGRFQRYETWEERIKQVTIGNYSLLPYLDDQKLDEFRIAVRLGNEGVMAYSGRHLQHGDADQTDKLMDLFSNCATSPFSFLLLWKSLCGKGVSSDYSSHVRPVNWDLMPNIRLVLDGGSDDSGDVAKGAHPDYKAAMIEFQGALESVNEARHKYPSSSEWVRWFKVDDSREGWATTIMALETAAYHERHRDKLFIFDFSDVRCAGSPIMGHQGRPASGPLPLMRALLKIATIKGAFMDPWKQAMYVDDYAAQCVSIGGVRRNARMAVMWYRDSNIFDFIEIKRGGHLRMANNTILVDDIFWKELADPRTHSYRVFQAATAAAYYDNTGDPGFANVHNMKQNRTGLENITAASYLNTEAAGLKLHPRTYDLIDKVLAGIRNGPYVCIPNPCGEACLSSMGDDCLVGDVGLHRARTINDACTAAELMGRALVRVSGLMPAICSAERKRTNRVGVSAIGIHEFFWQHFRLGFYDLLQAHEPMCLRGLHTGSPATTGLTEPQLEAMHAWETLGEVAQNARWGAHQEAIELGLPVPDTMTLLKPGGTVAKALSATESANLPSRRYYLRYIQYPKRVTVNNGLIIPNPKVEDFRKQGYPTIDIDHKYSGYVVVGFPTVQNYVRMVDDDGGCVATANNVSVEDHYKWLQLLERFWLKPQVKEEDEDRGAQIAYTLKYNPRQISYDQFMAVIRENQPKIRCCTFNVCSSDEEVFAETQELIHNYGYAPETPITGSEYTAYMARIMQARHEGYIDTGCEAGVCAVDEAINF